MPAMDALTVRTEMHRQLRNAGFRSLIDEYINYDEDHNVWGLGTFKVSKERRSWDAGAMDRTLAAAETFYVAPDMMMLAQRAMEDFPDDETVLISDQPSQAGFMHFAMPFRMVDIRGRTMVVHAVMWMNNRLWTIADRRDLNDDVSRELAGMNMSIGRYDIASMAKFYYNEPLPKTLGVKKGIIPLDAKVNFERKNGATVMTTDHAVDLNEGITEQVDGIMQFLLSVWRLMQQTLASVEHEETRHKGTVRDAIKAKVPSTGVTVISLRRREGSYEPTERTLDYRTLVRGHWRKVWCGPRKEPEKRYLRAVYVHPHIRGPEDAPLIIRERINALVR